MVTRKWYCRFSENYSKYIGDSKRKWSGPLTEHVYQTYKHHSTYEFKKFCSSHIKALGVKGELQQ